MVKTEKQERAGNFAGMMLELKRRWWIYVILLVYFGLSISLVVNRFRQFEVFYFDHGIFDGSLWQVAHFQPPLIDHLENTFINQMGDHFNPSFYLLAPLYWLTRSYEPILWLQALIIPLTGLVLVLLGKQLKLSKWFITVVLLAFLGFVGTQNVLIAQLHPDLLAMLTLSLTLLWMERKWWPGYWVGFWLTLGLKETFALPLITLGILLWWRGNKKVGGASILMAAIWFLGVTRVLMPILAGRVYQYTTSPERLLRFPYYLVDTATKRETILVSLTTFGFLPLMAGAASLLLFQDYLSRMVISTAPAHGSLGLHHNALLAVLLAYTAMYGWGWWKKRTGKWGGYAMIGGMFLATVYWHQMVYHGALGLSINADFYRHSQDFEFLDEMTQHIPAGATVMSMNNILPHLTHQTAPLLLRRDYTRWQPQVIALDTRTGQNPNDFWPLSEAQFIELAASVSANPDYTKVYAQGDQVVYQLNTR